MKRVLMAGVSLTVTACAMTSTNPSSTASLSRSGGQPSPYMQSLAATPPCTLWREVEGRRVCLDGAALPASEMLPRLPRAESPALAAADAPAPAPLVEPPPIAAPRMPVTSAPLAPPAAGKAPAETHVEPPMPPAATVTQKAQAGDLFAEMRSIGMIKSASAQAAHLPRLPRAARQAAVVPVGFAPDKAEANVDPKTALIVAGNDLSGLARVAPGVFAIDAMRPVRVRQAFAETALDAPIATATAVAAPRSDTAVPSWQPVAADPRVMQIADADPQPWRGVAGETAGRAPVAPVERATLPKVQSQRVVPLVIAKKATDDAPAMVVPAVAYAPRPAATQTAATLPPLPALPALPGEALAEPPKAAASKPTAIPLVAPPAPPPALPSAPRHEPALVKAPPPPPLEPLPARVANPAPAPEHKVVRAAASKGASPATIRPTANAAPGRHLVLYSFRDAERARRLAEQFSHLDAKVAQVTLHGQTWHRVVVRDGAAQRSRLAADGVRGYWPVNL